MTLRQVRIMPFEKHIMLNGDGGERPSLNLLPKNHEV
jgi:hypothetical protein